MEAVEGVMMTDAQRSQTSGFCTSNMLNCFFNQLVPTRVPVKPVSSYRVHPLEEQINQQTVKVQPELFTRFLLKEKKMVLN